MSSLPIASFNSIQSLLPGALLPGPANLPDSNNLSSSAKAAAQALAAAAAVQQLINGGGIILNPLLIRRADAPLMDLNLNQLLNSQSLSNAISQSNLQQLPPELLGKPQVIEAVVLRSSLLLNPPATQTPNNQLPINVTPNTTNPATTALEQILTYRIAVQWQGRILQLLSPQPLPQGDKVQLQVSARGDVLLLPNGATKTGLASSITQTPLLQPTNTPAPNPLLPKMPAQWIALQQALRENLPRQQPLHTLLPVLQKLAAPALREQLPAPLAKAVMQLLQAVPKPEQLQHAEGVKQALNNSGTNLEVRLARATAQTNIAPATTETEAETPAKILSSDLKAQLIQVFTLVKRLGFVPPEPARATVPSQNTDDLVYTARPSQRNGATIAAKNAAADSVDSLLTQLGKLLQAGLARIQLHQLDSASTRPAAGGDTANPVPAWVFELPLQTPRGADNLQLRIEQRQQQTRVGKARMQWTVQLAFDLHELGKLAATLTILDRDVAATIWSERKHTHRAVQEEIDILRNGLEAAGVKVTEVQCRLGLPPERSALLSQQLVDVRT